MECEDIPAQSTDCCSNCKSCMKKIADGQPSIVPEDVETRLWYKRAQCSRADLVFPFIAILAFIVDVGMDLEIAVTHVQAGHPKWAAYTLAIVVFSLIVIEIVSASWYYGDQKHTFKGRLLEQNGLGVKKWFYVCHLFFFGRILRSWHIFKTVLMVRGIKHESSDDMWRCRLYIAQVHDSSALAVLEAFTEEAPQFALQLYILFEKGSLDLTSFADVFVVINIIKSLVLFSYSWLSYVRALRKEHADSDLLQLVSFGSLSYFVWRLFMLVSRILALVLFASQFKSWVFLLAGIHFLLSCLILRVQECDYFTEEPIKQWFFKYIAIACVHMFCFFPLEGKHTRKSGIPFYLLTFIENSSMVLLWYIFSDYSLGFKVVMSAVEWGTFFMGLLALVLYYRCFHPSLGRARTNESHPTAGEGRVGVTEEDNFSGRVTMSLVQFASSV